MQHCFTGLKSSSSKVIRLGTVCYCFSSSCCAKYSNLPNLTSHNKTQTTCKVHKEEEKSNRKSRVGSTRAGCLRLSRQIQNIPRDMDSSAVCSRVQ